jgi:hypothetical protein
VSCNTLFEINFLPPYATLFLHENTMAHALSFEVELKIWRCAEIQAGRGDPGRPKYEDVFEVSGH